MKMERHISPLALLFFVFTALAVISQANAQVTLVSTGSVWKYLDDGSDQGTAWRAPGFVDSGWASGPAELGYGDGGEATTNSFGPNSASKYITTYYRLTFNVPDASSITNLRAHLKRDDGAVVFLNGTEVFRDNMPAGEITNGTFAVAAASDDGQTFIPHNFTGSALINGDNVLAVEIHQNAIDSSDISFDLQLIGNPLPSINITSPTNNQVITASALTVSGTALTGGTNVTSIELFNDTTLVGSASATPFSINWQNVTPGPYTLLAKITDTSGLVATSAPVSITVQAPPASVLIARGSTWKYNDKGTNLGTAWIAPAYSDSTANGWSGPAPGPFGYNTDAPQFVTTIVNIAPDNTVAGSRYPTVYFRKSINVSGASSYEGLILRIMRDDAATVYLNGTYLTNTPGGDELFDQYCCAASGAVGGTDEYTYFEYRVPSNLLVDGPNTFAVAGRQQAVSSSDLTFDMEVEGIIDVQAPFVVNTDPTPGSILVDFSYITVYFDAAVSGVNASDLVINGEGATNVVALNPATYQFTFPPQPTGTVHVAWSPTHGITDTSASHNGFDGSATWTYTYNTNLPRTANVIISEFMADNNNGIRDEDASHQDWIEIYNASLVDVNLNGWQLRDSSTNWFFPAVVLAPNKYLIVWASAKDRHDPNAPLHTNFKLDPDGEYLGLLDANTNVVSEFNPYPAQQPDISYGRDRVDPTIVGYFTSPTPGAQNTTGGPGFNEAPVISIDSGVFTNDSIIVSITGPVGGTIRYTLDGTVPTNNSPVYAGPITISVNTTLKARVYNPSTNLFPSQVVAETYMFLDSTIRDFNSNLPIIVLDSRTSIPAEVIAGGSRAKGAFLVFDTQGGRSFLKRKPDHQSPAEFEIYGQTSAGFPKKPYNIETQDELGNDKAYSILGMPAEADWKTRSTWDKTLINDFLAYECFEQQGQYSLRRRLVEVFVHQSSGKLTAADYGGVQGLFEKIEIGSHRVDLKKMTSTITNEPNITGGYIFKKDKNSVGDLDFATGGGAGFPGQGLKMHEPKPKELNNNVNHPQVVWLRNFLNTMEQKLYASTWLTATGTNHWSYYLDATAFADQFWIVEFPKQIDGYRLSDYFTKDRGGKMGPVPIWDWNLAWGNANYLDGGHYANWYWNQTSTGDHPWAKRLITGTTANTGVAGDPDFCQLIADRWGILRTNVFNGPRLLARIDELHALLTEAATRPSPLGDFTKSQFARLTTAQWPEPNGPPAWDIDYVTPPTYAQIIQQMKKWVDGRYNWVDSLFIPAPGFSQPEGMVADGTLITLDVPPNATNYYTLDGTDPRASGGGLAPGAIKYTGPFAVNANVSVVARARMANSGSAIARPFQNTWSPPAKRVYFTALPGLRITEIMYHPLPAPSGTNDADNFEFIEVQNISGLPLNLNQFRLTGGVEFNFPNVTLNAGSNAVVVANLAAFQLRYGTNNPNIFVLGVYSGNLDNGGECVSLLGPAMEPIQQVCFEDDWYPATDGHGFSLVNNVPTGSGSDPSNWNASSAINGSPGTANPALPSRPRIVVSEVLTFGDPTPDTIELHNTTANPVNIGGWYLTDDFDTPKKFLIPNTTIPGFSFVTFTTNSFGAGLNGFGLGSRGDDVYLFSGDGINLTGYAQGFDFGAAQAGVTFGRYIDSEGDVQYVAQASNTLGTTNLLPRVGPVVISEIHYHPSDILGVTTNGFNNATDEYIELQNIAGTNVPLYDVSAATNTWHLREGVEYDFPATNVVIPSGGFVLVVGFNPVTETNVLAGFRQRMGVPTSVPIFGPWNGQLDNNGESVELRKPRPPETSTNDAAYILVERIKYKDSAPWPPAADGMGLSLQRKSATGFGNDPTNWAAVGPTPGSGFVGGTAPVLTSQPGNTAAQAGATINLSATATGSNLRYQWWFNGQPIPASSNPTATNSTLVVSGFSQGQNGGLYNILVYNGGGSVYGTNFELRIRLGIITHPSDLAVLAGTTNSFTVVAAGAGGIRYQWYFNGNPINATLNPTATNASLTITNIQTSNEGTYFCIVSDTVDTLSSNPATLQALFRPGFIVPPLAVTTVEGGNATFTVGATGTVAMTFRWRTNGFTFPNGIQVNGVTNSSFTFTNVPLSFSNYAVTCVVTNLGGQSTPSSTARLFVLPDTDHDGLPDSWEDTHAGFDKNNPADGAADSDGDGMSNRAEYIAGTDYLDPSSYLKLQFLGSSTAQLQFSAVTNRSYSVQYTDSLGAGGWKKLADVLQRNVNRQETVVDNGPRTNRVYRLVIPIQP